jgi:hypothetical protein
MTSAFSELTVILLLFISAPLKSGNGSCRKSRREDLERVHKGLFLYAFLVVFPIDDFVLRAVK